MNEISILGFTPTVDPHSIKVEGAGRAVISDISVELRENQDFFQEIYPDSDEETSESSDDEDEPGHTSPGNSDDEDASRAYQDLKEVTKGIQILTDDIKRAAEVLSSAECRLKMLDEFSKNVEVKSGNEMSDIIQTYQDQRDKTFDDHMKGTIRQRELNSQIDGLRKTERKLIAQVDKEKKTASKVLRKEKQAKLRKLEQKNKREDRKVAEKERIRQERCRFWACYCYVVRITLDATQYTPISRRSSISSMTDLVKPATEDQETPLAEPDAAILTCDLSITYVTSDAYWSASYDLQLTTTSNTGTLFFDAQLINHTSESWKDCKIVLSTSQAIFLGLQDTIPKLHPWHIKLVGKSPDASDDIMSSLQEAYEQRMWKAASSATSRMSSGTGLIGISSAARFGRHHEQKVWVSLHSLHPLNLPRFMTNPTFEVAECRRLTEESRTPGKLVWQLGCASTCACTSTSQRWSVWNLGKQYTYTTARTSTTSQRWSVWHLGQQYASTTACTSQWRLGC